MQHVLVLGGGVGGTLVANLISRKIKKQIDAGEAKVTVVDQTGEHVYQPGFMYIAMGNQDPKSLRKPERRLLDDRVELVIGEATRIDDDARQVELGDGTRLDYDELIISLGSRILPEAVEHFQTEAHHFYTVEAAQRLRKALDSFTGGKVVVGIASMPYKCPPAPLEVVFLIEAELRQRGLREKSELHYCSPIARAFTIESVSEMASPELEAKGIELHTFFNVEAIDPERKVVMSLEGEELGYDLLVLVPPHKGAQVLMDSGIAPAPGGWLPTDHKTLNVGGREHMWALGDATDLPLSKAGSTAHFEAPVIAERVSARVQGRTPHPRDSIYTGKVMCFFEVGDGKGTLLRFDYEHPPKPPKPSRLWHIGKLVFNKTYYTIVPKGRGGSIEKRL
jgi:sulfide:quinone oxidoreductase